MLQSHIRCLDRDKKGRVVVRKWTKEEDVVAIEIKSGYGLSLSSEIKILRVIKRLKENTQVKIKSTLHVGNHGLKKEDLL